MAYCSNGDVSSEFKAIVFSSTTAVTDTEVTTFIVSADALIDSYLASRYETPITGDAALAIVKMISVWLVKSRILPILAVKAPEEKTKQDPDGPGYFDRAIKMLEKLKNGTLTLEDAVPLANSGGMASFNQSKTVCRTFSVDRKNW